MSLYMINYNILIDGHRLMSSKLISLLTGISYHLKILHENSASMSLNLFMFTLLSLSDYSNQ